MEKFIEWLNEEIEKLKIPGNDLFIAGKLSEAIRIRQMMCDMDTKDNSIDHETLEKIAGEICDHYCKFPEAYYTGHDDDNDRMIEERCNKCPLGKLI